jgi:hypothetical protein
MRQHVLRILKAEKMAFLRKNSDFRSGSLPVATIAFAAM